MNIRRESIILALFLCLISIICKGQTVIEGSIIPSTNAMVYAYPSNSSSKEMIAYTSSNTNGNYSLTINDTKIDSIRIVVRGIGIKTSEKVVANRSQTLNFQTSQKKLQLKEVVVKAEKIKEKGDTIEYNASSYLGKNDIVLKDILKKMPGITVSDDGKISFNGRWIKDFYIEGNDMLGDNYTIASNNVDAKSIATVQVLQNHQDAKVREGRLSDTPAINITLKEKSKGAIAGNLEAALGGSPLAREINGIVMKFTKTRQNISYIKTNNIGNSLSKDVNMRDYVDEVEGIGILLPSKAPLKDTWANRNDANAVSINQLFRLNDKRQITFSANYLKNKQKKNSNSISHYFLGADSTLTYLEDNSAESKIDEIGMNVQYKWNDKKKGYIKEKFHIDGSKSNIGSDLTDGEYFLNQQFNNKGLAITNNLSYLLPLTSTFRNFNSQISYNWDNSNLIFENTIQRVRSHHLTANNSGGIALKKAGGTQILAVASYSLDYRKIFTDNGIETNNANSLKNSLSFAPLIRYSPTHNIDCEAIFYLVGRNIIMNFDRETKKRYDFGFEPYANIKIKLSPKSDFCLSESYSQGYDDIMNMLPNTYYKDYRSIHQNSTLYKPGLSKKWKASVNYNYKNVLKMLFLNFAINYSDSKNPRSLGYTSSKGLLYYHLADTASYDRNLNFHQELSKGFYFWNSKMTEAITLGRTWNNYLISGYEIKSMSNYINSQLSFNLQPAKWMYINSENLLSITIPYKNSAYNNKNLTLNCKLQTDFALASNVVLSLNGQLYHSNYQHQKNTNKLANIYLNWNMKRIRLYAKCINLFNNRYYHRVYTTNVIQQIDDIALRGRTFLAGFQLKVF